MSKYLSFYDVESTGFPSSKKDLLDDTQPHLVSLSAIRCRKKSGRVKDVMNVIVKPNGWESHPDAEKVHGISTDYANEHGIPEDEVVDAFLSLVKDSIRISHNKFFDSLMMDIAVARYSTLTGYKRFPMKKHYCTMKMAGVSNSPSKGLDVVYKHYFDETLTMHHNAMADTEACKAIYYAMRGEGIQP